MIVCHCFVHPLLLITDQRFAAFQRLVETLSKDDNEIQRRLAEMTRKVTVLRVNEKALTRRYTAMQDIERNLRKELNKTRNDMIHMETAVSERLGYLQRHKASHVCFDL